MRIELAKNCRDLAALRTFLGVGSTEDAQGMLAGIATDSREVLPGDLFVALPGKRQNGAVFIEDAFRAGAAAVLTEEKTRADDARVLFVPSVTFALLRAAGEYRRRYGKTVVAVTGSTGKTTAKEGISALLREKGSVQYSRGNFNSNIGMPLSLLSFEVSDFWVSEIGVSHTGEMREPARAAMPDLAVLTNVGTAHIGNYGNFAALQAEKAEITAHLSPVGAALVPAEVPNAVLGCPAEKIFHFGSASADFFAEKIVNGEKGVTLDFTAQNRYERKICGLSFPIAGKIGVSALEILASVGVLLGLTDDEIMRGVAAAGKKTPRFRVLEAGDKLLFDDTYNASPESVAGALESFAHRAGDRVRVAVLGDMLELGAYSEALHDALGEAAARSGVSLLVSYGKFAAFTARGAARGGIPASNIHIFGKDERERLKESLPCLLPADAAVLFKGSGAMRMNEFLLVVKEGTI